MAISTSSQPPKESTTAGDDVSGESKEQMEAKASLIRQQIKTCEENLRILNDRLQTVSSASSNESSDMAKDGKIAASVGRTSLISMVPDKAGYLWKWQDRQIGWGGTKWDLRFVKLDGRKGQLMYYRTHTTSESHPRYMINLRGCAVRDDGEKPQKRSEGFYYVFSVYLKNQKLQKVDQEDESQIVPLLRFSTESLAEKMQWIEIISEACAYCDTTHHNSSAFPVPTTAPTPNPTLPNNIAKPVGIVYNMSMTQLTPTPGTLSPIYFGENYRRKAKSKDTAKSNPRTTSGYPPSRPMHQSAEPSYLSYDAADQNYRGFLNLGMVILIVSNFRLIFDSFKKHGIVLLSIPGQLAHYRDGPLSNSPFVTGEILLHAFVIVTFLIERGLSRRVLAETMGTTLHVVNCALTLLVPVWIVWYYIENPVTGCVLLLQSVISCAKLISYVHANSDYRKKDENGFMASFALVCDVDEGEQVSYPRNVTLSNIYYFYYAPTLTYQIAFPRNRRIRWFYVLGLVLRISVGVAFLGFLFTQTIMPQLDVTRTKFEEGKLTNRALAEVVLKLSIPNTYCWLVFFYLYFHLLLNLCAELLRFGDRVFYRDWWNSSEVSAYWRLWNTPVHYWLIRHVYFPAIRSGASKNTAMLTVFFISAVLHEILISVPFHMIRAWSFIGMMGQVPLVWMTKRLEKKFPGSSIGNIIFWISFCMVGQPTAILFYAIDYWKLGVTSTSPVLGMESCIGTECEL